MNRISVKRIGGSLYLRLPFTFKHKFDVKENDVYEPVSNADGSIIKYIRVDEQEVTEAAE
jgi:hypothetical protein